MPNFRTKMGRSNEKIWKTTIESQIVTQEENIHVVNTKTLSTTLPPE